MASVFRKVSVGHITIEEHRRNMRNRYDEGYKSAREGFEKVLEGVKQFEQRSGVKILSEDETRLDWNYGDIADAVKMVVKGEHLHIKRHLSTFLDDVKRVEERINSALKNQDYD